MKNHFFWKTFKSIFLILNSQKMKQLLILTLTLVTTLTSFSQNGGQANENNILKITYTGWYSGSHHVTLQNKLNCSVKANYNFDGVVKDTLMLPLSTVLLTKSALATSVLDAKAKRISGADCVSTPDNGWVEVKTILSSLPIKFKSIGVSRIDSKTIRLTFEAEEDNTISHYNVRLSNDGKSFKTITVIFPDGVEGSKIYSAIIKL